jgi:hypothetical protein
VRSLRALWRDRRWLSVDLDGVLIPGNVKLLTVSELAELSEGARVAHGSAVGRPQWLSAHTDQVRQILLTVLFTESGLHRCMAIVKLLDGSRVRFTVDVPVRVFEPLRDLSQFELVSLVHDLLADIRTLPLDPDQARSQEAVERWRREGHIGPGAPPRGEPA